MNVEEVLHSFYDKGLEEARFSSKHGLVEFLTTTRYIDKYIKAGDRILEVGCGTGAYTLHYARRGFEVDAVELIQKNLEILRQKLQPSDHVRVVQGNALDLSGYADNSFDITLVLGPMYHLFSTEEKLQCLREAQRVTKSGGTMFVAYCQFDASMVQAGFIRNLYDFLVENHLLNTENYTPISNPAGIFELHRKEQIDALDENLYCERLHYVGTDMFTHYYEEQIDQMEESLYQKYLEYLFTICENQNIVGVSNHTLDILKKL